VLCIRINFFRIQIQKFFLPFSDSDSKTNILTWQFSKEWLPLHSYVLYCRTCETITKGCFAMVFRNSFLFYIRIWIRIRILVRIWTFFSDSGNRRILSDSDPQDWAVPYLGLKAFFQLQLLVFINEYFDFLNFIWIIFLNKWFKKKKNKRLKKTWLNTVPVPYIYFLNRNFPVP
jgi:hypothetical protein